MKKKLQIFVSSTYLDLKEERQAAVEAILSAGHIPAGMELFAAGDVTQLEIIKKWIEESDVYMLILGGRYGSIEPKTQKSYTHIEYDYAVEKGKPFFSVYASDLALSHKRRQLGEKAVEIKNTESYGNFKKKVLGMICRPFDDAKDIKIAIHESLKYLQEKHDFDGWVSVKDLKDSGEIAEDNLKLTEENKYLKSQLQERLINQINGCTYDEIINVLSQTHLRVPGNIYHEIRTKNSNIWDLFLKFQDKFVEGVQDEYGNYLEMFLYQEVAPKLILFGVVQRADHAGSMYHRVRATQEGKNLLRYILLKEHDKEVTADIL